LILKERLLDADVLKNKTTSFITSDTFLRNLLGSLGLLVVLFWAIMSNYALGLTQTSAELRTPASLNIPHVGEVDEGDIIESYEPYLNFVIQIGNKVNYKITHKIIQKYTKLKEIDQRKAALFLKGLRYEIEHFRTIQGLTRKTQISQLKLVNWVREYLIEWYREVDEYFIRAYVEKFIRS